MAEIPPALAEVWGRVGRAMRIGVTGPPGSLPAAEAQRVSEPNAARAGTCVVLLPPPGHLRPVARRLPSPAAPAIEHLRAREQPTVGPRRAPSPWPHVTFDGTTGSGTAAPEA